ncbi:MAG: dihydrolipoyllysine-residue succinyltransferase [Desulfuromonas sp.]|nr:MAG: dihydrolipoyllysine-residue succinyltransferase [Desulfuromonas sp.]
MDIKVPEVGESIVEALIVEWHFKDGQVVEKGQTVCELETDKVNVEVEAEVRGVLSIKIAAGETVQIGTVIATLAEKEGSEEPPKPADQEKPVHTARLTEKDSAAMAVNPAARKLAEESQVDLSKVAGSGPQGRILVEDVQRATPGPSASLPAPVAEATEPSAPASATAPSATSDSRVHREKMSPLRKRIAERLVSVRRETAMLTTFNEIDLARVQNLRHKHGEHFRDKHGVKLGLMSFFVKAVVEGLKEFPTVNARIDGDEIVYQQFYDIGIAVGSERGLVVPVLRDADQLDFAGIEKQIAELAQKVSAKKISIAELEGGTFSITNGGVYGSLLSTPMLNPPQAAILGMHAIKERAVVVNGEIVVRPMMNLALSYDHRLIDGREAVSFLKTVVELIEDPEEMLLEL